MDNGYVDISSFSRGSQCILGSLGANKVASVLQIYNAIDDHVFLVFARSFLQNLINIYKECLLFRRADVRYMSVGIEIVFTELWPSLLMENRPCLSSFRAMYNEMIAAYPKVFEAYQFSSKTIKEHLKKSSKDGTWEETIDSFSCATVLQRTRTIYSATSQKSITIKSFEPRFPT